MLQPHSNVFVFILPCAASHLCTIHWRTPSNSIHFPVINGQRVLVVLPDSQYAFSTWRELYQHHCSLVESLQDYFLLFGVSIPYMHIHYLVSWFRFIELCHLASRAILAVLGDWEGNEVVWLALVERLAARFEVHFNAKCRRYEETSFAAFWILDLVSDSVVDVEIANSPHMMDL